MFQVQVVAIRELCRLHDNKVGTSLSAKDFVAQAAEKIAAREGAFAPRLATVPVAA